jgi:hypothetical protein
MAFGGVLQVLFGRVTRGLRAQTLVACVYTAANLLFALRDLSTSDSRFGNHLYRGDATLFFVVVDLAIASAYGALSLAGLRRLRAGLHEQQQARHHAQQAHALAGARGKPPARRASRRARSGARLRARPRPHHRTALLVAPHGG